MGFYDCSCMITGVSLTGMDASTTLVVLRRIDENYLPITLGITGTYNGFGGIDEVREDLNTELVVRYFLDRYRDGRFFADDQTSPVGGEVLTADSHIEELLELIERTHLAIDDGIPPSTVLDGDMIVFALIAQPIWDAIVEAAPVCDRSPDRQAERLFGPASTATEIYEGRLPELATSLDQLTAVNDFVEAHGLRWAPPTEPSQRYPDGGEEAVEEFFDRAKHDYQDNAVISAGLARYEQLIDWETLAWYASPAAQAPTRMIEVEPDVPLRYAVIIDSDEKTGRP